ncbi:MAG: hypothetical protein V5A66_00125 [Candidatus Thermoplasmatota archaeon]
MTALGTSLLYRNSQGWWFPISGAGVAILGLYSSERKIVDVGSLFLVGSFFFLVKELPLNYTSLIFLISMFFIYIGLWLFMRRSLFIKYMKRGLTEEGVNIHLEEYKNDSALYYLKTLVLGFAVSLLGGFISINSFIGPFPLNLIIFLRILLALSIVFGIYFVLFLLPRYMSK